MMYSVLQVKTGCRRLGSRVESTQQATLTLLFSPSVNCILTGPHRNLFRFPRLPCSYRNPPWPHVSPCPARCQQGGFATPKRTLIVDAVVNLPHSPLSNTKF